MNEKSCNRLSNNNTDEVSQRDPAVVPTDNTIELEDDELSKRSTTYESFFWLFNYSKMFTTRLAKDILTSVLHYVFSDRVLPDHILDLINVQKRLRTERGSHTATYSRRQRRAHTLSMREFYKTFKSYILSSEDDFGLQFTRPKNNTETYVVEREPIFVIVDSSCVRNPSSKELLFDSKANSKDTILNKYYNKTILPADLPSTSKDHVNMVLPPQLKESDSLEELQMVDINLQSDNDLSIRADSENENESIVISYIRNKDAIKEIEAQLSETSLDVHIPSFPGSPRSFWGSHNSQESQHEKEASMKKIADLFHDDNEFLVAADIGDVKTLETLIRSGINIQELDHLGRNALHLAICSGNERAVMLLIKAGVDVNVKDNVGMTPLSLCLMRSPSLLVASLLFEHGAKIAPRQVSMDTGLFLQFVMMSIPTSEEEKVIRLLVEKGALINDPEAPGRRQALHYAAMSGNCKLIKILIDLGADISATNHRNETPKDVALTFRCFQAYFMLDELEKLKHSDTADRASEANAPIACL